MGTVIKMLDLLRNSGEIGELNSPISPEIFPLYTRRKHD